MLAGRWGDPQGLAGGIICVHRCLCCRRCAQSPIPECQPVVGALRIRLEQAGRIHGESGFMDREAEKIPGIARGSGRSLGGPLGAAFVAGHPVIFSLTDMARLGTTSRAGQWRIVAVLPAAERTVAEGWVTGPLQPATPHAALLCSLAAALRFRRPATRPVERRRTSVPVAK